MYLVENTQHRLLKRQLKKHLPIEMAESIELRAFVEAIDQAYQEFDTDIKRTENILEQSSRELFRANQELKQYADDKAKEAKAIADRLQVVADSISDVIFQLDLSGKFTYLNSAWTLITAHNIQTSIGKCILDYIHPDSYTDFKLELEGLFKNHVEIRSYTTKIRTKTGELRYIKINIKLNDNLTENSEGASGSITDVTEGHLAQKEKERLAMLVRKSNNIILVADTKGRIEWANHAFTRITGYDLDEVKGKKPGDVLQGKNTNPETVKYISDQLKKQQSVNCEIINYSKSGREYWLEVSIDPIYDENGNLDGYIAVESEITERKLQEEALIRSEAKLSAVMNNIPDFIFYKNIDGVYEMGNESMARFLNISPKEIEGKTDFDLHSKLVAEAIIKDDQELLLSKQTKTVEGEIEIEGKERVLLETTKAVIQDQNGMAKGLVGVSRDVTAIKKAKEKEAAYIKDLEKINQELDQFAYIVSHDLKAPLRAINNLSTWIQEDLEDKMDEDTHEQFALLRGRVLRMEGLINGILQYSRAGRITATEQTVDLNELVKEITDALSDGYKAKIEIDENLPIIETEKVALDQVFSNLISNALKYNNKELAQVKISSKANGQFHYFRIEDNGPGIAEEFREKVFVIFQTLNARDEVESTGVGLAIVKKIIEDKGGELYIDDSELGGAAFHFSWPKVYTKKQQNVN